MAVPGPVGHERACALLHVASVLAAMPVGTVDAGPWDMTLSLAVTGNRLQRSSGPGSSCHQMAIHREPVRQLHYFVHDNSEPGVPSLSEFMNRHQVEWRRSNVSSTEIGTWQGKPRPWIVPRCLWEEGLWPGIRKGSDNPLATYLECSGVQKHSGVHNLKSSWILCANLYFPFRESDQDRRLLASFLRQHVARPIESLEAIELEYSEGEDSDLHPSRLLGEAGGSRGAGQTSPDLGLKVNYGRGLVLVESKFTEPDFSSCSARNHEGNAERAANPDPDRCNHPLQVLRDPAGQCHQSAWGRRYWEHLAAVTDREALAAMPYCPAARRGYQLFRQTALAEGIARSGEYDLIVSAVALDERNEDLNECLQKLRLSDLHGWGTVFRGQAVFAVFAHQQWLGWVREHDREGRWREWLSWIADRYAM